MGLVGSSSVLFRMGWHSNNVLPYCLVHSLENRRFLSSFPEQCLLIRAGCR